MILPFPASPTARCCRRQFLSFIRQRSSRFLQETRCCSTDRIFGTISVMIGIDIWRRGSSGFFIMCRLFNRIPHYSEEGGSFKGGSGAGGITSSFFSESNSSTVSVLTSMDNNSHHGRSGCNFVQGGIGTIRSDEIWHLRRFFFSFRRPSKENIVNYLRTIFCHSYCDRLFGRWLRRQFWMNGVKDTTLLFGSLGIDIPGKICSVVLSVSVSTN
mmetsp:Transcript_14870/g.22993  ORF Transcript_14870/g.22993 Transcript_14870/m.22993 type:complete len:214 (+) Transcript_14870:648-1289(+)